MDDVGARRLFKEIAKKTEEELAELSKLANVELDQDPDSVLDDFVIDKNRVVDRKVDRKLSGGREYAVVRINGKQAYAKETIFSAKNSEHMV
jgi:hypothetical protein